MALLLTGCVATESYSNANFADSAFTASPTGLLANGSDNATLQVVVHGAGRPLPGLTVTFSGDDCTFEQPSGPTDANGMARGLVRSTRAGPRNLLATVSQGDFAQALPLAVSVQFFLPAQTVGAAPGQPLTLQMSVVDPNGAVNTNFVDTVYFVSSDPNATLPPPYSVSVGANGQISIPSGLVLHTLGVQTVTAIDTRTGEPVAEQQFVVAPGPAATFAVSGLPSTLQAGSPITLGLVALDAYGNIATGYYGTVHASCSDANATVPADVAFNGSGQVQLAPWVLRTTGTQTVTLVDEVTLTPSYQATIAVQSAPPVQLRIGAPVTAVAGAPQTVTVTAVDAYGNAATAFTGAFDLTVSDAQAVAPAGGTLVAATDTLDVVLKTSGPQTLSVTDALGILQPDEVTVQVSDAGFSKFAVQAAAQVVAGTYLPVTVLAMDNFNNLALSYQGTARFVSSDSRAVVPANHTYITSEQARFAFVALVYTAGTQTVSVADSSQPGDNGVAQFTVLPATTATLDVTGLPAHLIAGTGSTLTVTAHDAYGNVTPSYTGQLHLMSSDGKATLPGDASLVANDAGLYVMGTATLATAGTQTVSVVDLQDSNTVGPPVQTQVTAAAASALAFTQTMADQNVCVVFSVTPTVQSVDAFGNPSPASGQVVLSRQGANPNNALLGSTLQSLDANGRAAFANVRLTHPTALTLVATMLSGSLSAATSSPFTIQDAPLSVSIGSPSRTQGCINVPYTVVSACAFDAVVDVDPFDTGAFGRATQAAGTAGTQGVSQVRASNGTFVWDSTRDIRGVATTNAAMRITVSTATQSASQTVSALTINNGPAFSTQSLSAGASVPCVATADFNGDGAIDIAGCSTNGIQSWANNGNGLFATAVTHDLTSSPTALVAGDINRDGKMDLLAAAHSGSAVVLLGDGTGSLAAGSGFSLASNVVALALADINRDGRPDIVAALGAPSNSIDVWPQSSSGTYSASSAQAIPAAVVGLATGDVNNDGSADVVAAAGNQVYVLLGNGTALGAPTAYAAGAVPLALALGDVNYDGNLDTVIVSSSGLAVLLGSASGALGAATSVSLSDTPTALTMADFNHDGAIDCGVAMTGGGVLLVLGDGHGHFAASVSGTTASTALALLQADISRDGWPDMVTADSGGTVSVVQNSSAHPCSWRPNAPAGVGVASLPSTGAIADFNGDGRPDVAVASSIASLATVLLGDGSGALAVGNSYLVGANPNVIVALDLNGDGNTDLLTVNSGGGTVTSLVGDGTGRFTVANQGPFVGQLTGLAAGDMDNDGAVDAVIAAGSGLLVLHNRGDGTLSLAGTYAGDANTTGVAIGDINQDGLLDAVGVTTPGKLRVYLGTGGGMLAPLATTVTLCVSPSAVQITTLDTDNHPDVAVACNDGGSTVQAWSGDGSGNFALFGQFSAIGAAGLAVGDWNRDGYTDLATGSSSRLSVGWGNGAGQFTAQTMTTQDNTAFVLDVDLNGDGADDLVSIQQSYATAHVNDGNGNLGALSSANANAGPGVSLLDINHDGAIDTLVQAWYDSFTTLLGDGLGNYVQDNGIYISGAGGASALGDINGDGWVDIITTEQDNPNALTYLNSKNAALWTASAMLYNGVPSYSNTCTALADMNRDGVVDAIVCEKDQDCLVFLGSTSGVFAAPYTFLSQAQALQVLAIDINQDGYDDVLTVSGNCCDAWIGIKFNDGTGHPDSINGLLDSTTVNINAGALAVADLNNDGISDFAIAPSYCPSSGCPYVFIAMGQGGGNFAPPSTLPLAASPINIGAADLNGDGAIDVWAPVGDYGVAVMLGNGRGQFSAAQYVVMDAQPQATAAADVNRDGIVDLVSSDAGAGITSDNVVVRLGR